MINMGDRPQYTAAEIARFTGQIEDSNTDIRKMLFRGSLAENLVHLRYTVVNSGFHLSRASAISTSNFTTVKLEALRDVTFGTGDADKKLKRAYSESLFGTHLFAGILNSATVPANQRGDYVIDTFSNNTLTSADNVDPIAQAEEFLGDLTRTEELSKKFSYDPSGFSFIRDMVEGMEEYKNTEVYGIPEQSFVLAGVKDAAEWYKSVYMLGYRVGLGPAPRILKTNK